MYFLDYFIAILFVQLVLEKHSACILDAVAQIVLKPLDAVTELSVTNQRYRCTILKLVIENKSVQKCRKFPSE